MLLMNNADTYLYGLRGGARGFKCSEGVRKFSRLSQISLKYAKIP